MYRYFFKVCPTNFCYEVDVVSDDLSDAIEMVMLSENVDIEYIHFIKYEYVK